MKLKDIMFTDCYVEFDSNEQLRDFVQKHKIKANLIFNDEMYIRIRAALKPFTVVRPEHHELPVHHHSTIEL